MRLTLEGEDLRKLTEAELNAAVHPVDVASVYLDHGAKQAIALANLRHPQCEERSRRANAVGGDAYIHGGAIAQLWT